MPTVIIRGKLEKSYDHWVAAFNAHESARKAVGLNVLYRGYDLNDSGVIHIVMHTPSMETLSKFMQDNAEYIKESGNTPGSLELTVCSDM